MKNISLKTLFIASAIFLSINACTNKKTDPTPTTSTTLNVNNNGHSNTDVNTWIYNTMKSWYYWTDNIPDKTTTELTQDPGDYTKGTGYFYSLLYKYGDISAAGTIDHNSWIQNLTDLSNTLNHVSTSYGFYRKFFSYGTNNVVAVVSNVDKGSPAEKAGLQRGDMIVQVNGVQLTRDNYSTLINASDTDIFTLADFDGTNFTTNGKTITASKTVVTENTVTYSKVITKGSKKIGYFVYTGFVSNYDNDMRAVFANFKAQSVNELVLDLRLNGGGSVNSADILSSLIVKNLNTANILHKDDWNPTVNQYLTSTYGPNSLISNFKSEANNLNLSRLFVLVSGGTASASELVINSLKPFIPVILVGETTYGKNVFSVSLTDNSNTYSDLFSGSSTGANRWNWGLQPIVGRTVNSAGESIYGVTKQGTNWVFQGGFVPDYVVTDNKLPYKAWGDETETLLTKALSVITGSDVQALANARISATMPAKALNSLHFSDEPNGNSYTMFKSLDFSTLKKK